MSVSSKKEPTSQEAPVTLAQVQELLKLSRPTLRRMIRLGKIRSHKVGGRKLYFFLSEVYSDLKKM